MTGKLDAIRTDVVGSLLRPASWRKARQGFDKQTLNADGLLEIELACVRDLENYRSRSGLTSSPMARSAASTFRTASDLRSAVSMGRARP